MEMWWRVVSVEYGDDDTEKAANFRYGLIPVRPENCTSRVAVGRDLGF